MSTRTASFHFMKGQNTMTKWIGRPILLLAIIAAAIGTASVASASTGTTPSTTVVASSAPSTFVGESVTYTATVTATSDTGQDPTGSVVFTDGGSPITCTGANNGTLVGVPPISSSFTSNAQCTTTYTAPETGDVVEATYSGDTNYASSAGETTETVAKGQTSLTLSQPAGTPVTGQSVVFTATLAVTAGAGTPTGTVTFKNTAVSPNATECSGVGLTSTGSPPVITAQCSVVVGLTSTNPTIVATYTGDGDFAGSTSAPLAATAPTAASTTVQISPSVNPSQTGQSVTFKAIVAPVSPGGGIPGGSVTFTVSGISVCTSPVTLSGGSASCTVPGSDLSAGTTPTVTVSASYSGSASVPLYSASTSSNFTQTVDPGFTNDTLVVTPNRAPNGGPVNLTVVVVPLPPAAGSPTGQVSYGITALHGRHVIAFLTCSSNSNLATLSNGSATCSLPTIPASANKLSVNVDYFGDPNFSGASTTKVIKLHA